MVALKEYPKSFPLESGGVQAVGQARLSERIRGAESGLGRAPRR